MLIECQLSNGGKWWRIESYFFVLSSNRRTCVVPRYLFLKVRPKSAVRHFNRSMQSLFFVIAKNYEPLVRRMCQNEWITEIIEYDSSVLVYCTCSVQPLSTHRGGSCSEEGVAYTAKDFFDLMWNLFSPFLPYNAREITAICWCCQKKGQRLAIPSYHKLLSE